MDESLFNAYTSHDLNSDFFKNYNMIPDIDFKFTANPIPIFKTNNPEIQLDNIQEDIPLDNYNYDISFEDLIKQENLPIIITSGYRGKNGFRSGKTASGKVSNHSKVDDKGNPLAVDIQPSFGKSEADFEKLRLILYTNPRVINWFIHNNKGILEENTPKQMAHYGATGPNWHIGPDSVAIKNFNNQLEIHGIQIAKEGTKLPNLSIYTKVLPEPNKKVLNIPDIDFNFEKDPTLILNDLNLDNSVIDNSMFDDSIIDNSNLENTTMNTLYHFGNTNNKEKEFATVMVPIFAQALLDEGIETTKDNLDNLVKLAALESDYGLQPRGKQGYNLSGIKWFKGCPYGKTKGEDGLEYVDFPNLEDYAKYKVRLLNDKYQAFSATTTTDFVNRLHGNNPSHANYSASKDKYLSNLNNMKTLSQYLV